MIVEITGAKGEFTLKDVGTTGHVWEVTEADGVAIEKIPSAGAKQETDAPIGGGHDVRYRATGRGTATMVLKRPWEAAAEPVERVDIVVSG